ncbi:MAG TPA: hypothetical protein PJ982_11370 [Lacipirellulaceae bacterium]|nr:hypothetical protein [Lacipirellulaceae bacterium]
MKPAPPRDNPPQVVLTPAEALEQLGIHLLLGQLLVQASQHEIGLLARELEVGRVAAGLRAVAGSARGRIGACRPATGLTGARAAAAAGRRGRTVRRRCVGFARGGAAVARRAWRTGRIARGSVGTAGLARLARRGISRSVRRRVAARGSLVRRIAAA